MAIGHDANSWVASGSTETTSVNWSHTIGVGTDRCLIVFVQWFGTTDPSSVTLGGQSLTAVAAATRNGSVSTRMYRLVAPNTGAGTITVTWAATTEFINCGAVSFDGVDQTTPIDATSAGSTGNGSPLSDSVTTVTANAWVVAGAYLQRNATFVAVSPSTLVGQSVVESDRGGAVYRGPIATPASTSASVTYGGPSRSWAMQAVAIRPAAEVVIHTADGAATITKPTADGTGVHTHPADGSPSITPVESTGEATRFIKASGYIHSIISGQTEVDYDAVGDNGAFNGGTGYGSNDLIVLDQGVEVQIDSAPGGVVDAFSLDTSSSGSIILGVPLNYVSGSVGGAGFSLTPQINNVTGNGTDPSITKIEASGSATLPGDLTTADGAPSITTIESAGVSEVVRTADGSPSVTKATADGTGIHTHPADGAPSITKPVADGTAEAIKTADGSPSIVKPTADGTSEIIKTADGAASIAKPTADGTAEAIKTADGSPSVTKPTADGTAEITRTADGAASITKPIAEGTGIGPGVGPDQTADGAPSISNVIAAGIAEVINTADGAASISNITAAGLGVLERIANGGPSVSKATAAGNSFIWPKVYLNTTETLSGATEMSVVSVETDGTGITFNDDAGAPTGSLFLGVENRVNGDVGWIPVTVAAAIGPIVLFGSFGA